MQASLKEGRMTRPATQPASAPAAPAAPPAARSRRRGEVLEAALLDAAWAELQAVGYAGLTMEAVADRAGTSRAVLYRRWRNRPELVIAAMRRHRPMLSGEIPDTGSLRGDVLAVLRLMSSRLTEIGTETVYGLLGEYLGDAEMFARSQDQVLHISAEVMTTILARAAPSDEAITQIVDQVFLPLVRPG